MKALSRLALTLLLVGPIGCESAGTQKLLALGRLVAAGALEFVPGGPCLPGCVPADGGMDAGCPGVADGGVGDAAR